MSSVQGGWGGGHADGGCRVGEVDRGRQRQDGEVEVGGVVVVARVLGDGRDVVPVRHGVRGVVLAHQHLAQCALGWFTDPRGICFNLKKMQKLHFGPKIVTSSSCFL